MQHCICFNGYLLLITESQKCQMGFLISRFFPLSNTNAKCVIYLIHTPYLWGVFYYYLLYKNKEIDAYRSLVSNPRSIISRREGSMHTQVHLASRLLSALGFNCCRDSIHMLWVFDCSNS